MACGADRSGVRAAQTALATEHAWEVARIRCPEACPPMELADTVEWQPPAADGVCRDDRVYFTARVFFRCGG